MLEGLTKDVTYVLSIPQYSGMVWDDWDTVQDNVVSLTMPEAVDTLVVAAVDVYTLGMTNYSKTSLVHLLGMKMSFMTLQISFLEQICGVS